MMIRRPLSMWQRPLAGRYTGCQNDSAGVRREPRLPLWLAAQETGRARIEWNNVAQEDQGSIWYVCCVSVFSIEAIVYCARYGLDRFSNDMPGEWGAPETPRNTPGRKEDV